MIIFILNEPFFYNGGFSKRCQREVEILSQQEKIIIISRAEKLDNLSYKNKNVQFITYGSEHSFEISGKQTSTFYSLYKNTQMLFPLLRKLYKVIRSNSADKDTIKVYVVSSPITVGLFCLFITKFTGIQKTILEFHDLEPEMAIHIKKLKKTSMILKIEYFLEKLLCQQYAKIIVTNTMQSDILQKRAEIKKEKIFVLPNTISEGIYAKKKITKKINEFTIGYVSTLRFGYTFLGLCELIKKMTPVFKIHPDMKLVIIGRGEGLDIVTDTIIQYSLGKYVYTVGHISDVSQILSTIDIGIIPWIKDSFSNTILPTKLFEYLASQIPVIVPDFGVFPEIIKNGENGLLFTSIDDLIVKILYLKDKNKKKDVLAQHGFDSFINNYSLNHYTKSYSAFLKI